MEIQKPIVTKNEASAFKALGIGILAGAALYCGKMIMDKNKFIGLERIAGARQETGQDYSFNNYSRRY